MSVLLAVAVVPRSSRAQAPAGDDVRDTDDAPPDAPLTAHCPRRGRARATPGAGGGAGAQQPADRAARRLRRPGILRAPGGRGRLHRRLRPLLLSAIRSGAVPRPGFGWVFLGDIMAPVVNTRGEVADLGAAPGVVALRQHQLARRARLHRQRGEPVAALRADAGRAGVGQHQLHAAHRPRLRAGRRVRRRHRAGGMAAWRIAADVIVRRQERPGLRHRIPRPQVRSPLRHHAVADRALHDGDRAGRQAAHQAGAQRLVRHRAGADQRIEHDRAVPLLRRDRQQRRQDGQRPARGRGCRCRSTSRSVFRAATARKIAPPTPNTRCGFSVPTCSRTGGGST